MLKIIYTFLFFLLLSLPASPAAGSPGAIKGKLDLSEWNFDKYKIVKLDGEWEFYPDQFIIPGNEQHYPPPEYIHVPGPWNNHQKKHGRTPYGYGTYRLEVNINSHITTPALYFHYVNYAYKVFINGKEILSVGSPGTDKESSIPQTMVCMESFINDRESTEIIIHIANYWHRRGGLVESITMGDEKEIIKQRENNLVIDFSIIGCLFFVSLYHFYFFLIRKQDISIIYFIMVCLLISLRTLIIGEVFIKELFPQLTYIFLLRLEYIGNFLTVIAFNGFFRSFYSHIYSKKLFYTINVFCILFCLILCISSGIIISKLFAALQILAVFTTGYAISILIIAAKEKSKEPFFFLAGFLIFTLTLIFDIVLYNLGFYYRGLLWFGVIVLIFFQSFLITRRFEKVFKRAEHLSQNLKNEVDEKTLELKEQNIRQKKFFITFAHETKTPLTLISNYLYSYMKEVKSDFKLDIIHNNIEKLKRDMNNLLDLEKLEKNKEFYNHETLTNISEVLENTMPLFKKYAHTKKQRITSDIQRNLYVKADLFAVERIINNLLDNSFKYTPEQGSIKIMLKKQTETMVFSVTDNGIGISKEHISSVFKPYHQIKHKKKNYQGIGLGLAIVNSIVKSLNGHIDVKSCPGKGTTFSISLPISMEKMSATNSHHPSKHPGNYVFTTRNKIDKKIDSLSPDFDGTKKTILIIDDNPAMVYLLKSNLQEGFNTFSASSGNKALRIIENIPTPDVIISDIMMDDMDGFEFLIQLKKISRCEGIPFIYISAKTSLPDKLRGLKLGAIDYIEKPFDIEELKEKIISILIHAEKTSTTFIKESTELLYRRLNKDREAEANMYRMYENNYDKFNLSVREREIINLIKKGYQYKEIAIILGISKKTVNNHMQHIFQKTNVRTTAILLNLLAGEDVDED